MMKRQFLLSGLLLAAGTLFSAEERVRNPFWPQGFEGVRYAISEEPRYPTRPNVVADSPTNPKLKPGESVNTITNSVGRVMQVVDAGLEGDALLEEANKTPEQIEDELWKEASRHLQISDSLSFISDGRMRQSININGLVYSDGDLISVNVVTNRFTWLVRGYNTNGVLRIERIKYRPLAPGEH